MDITFCRLVLIHQPLITITGHTEIYKTILEEMYRITRTAGKVIAIEPYI